MRSDSKIFIAGHRGLVGSALCRVLRGQGYTNLVTVSRSDVDLTDPVAAKWFFSSHLPEYVFLAAARVGGISANATYPVEFMLENLRIQDNVISNARDYKVKKLLFLGSACAYPKFAENPIREDSLLTGMLEPSNECYALAKICGIKLCQAYRSEYDCDFISAMPTNLYGVGDHYDLRDSHVLPGMIRRMHEARMDKSVTLWGTGNPTREFLFSDDLAEACIVLMQQYSGPGQVNIGSGRCVALKEAAKLISEVTGFRGEIIWDSKNHPDGTPLREMDSSTIRGLGWEPRTDLWEGLQKSYMDFLCRQHS